MSEVQLKNIKCCRDMPGPQYDNPGYQDGDTPPPYPADQAMVAVDVPNGKTEFSPNDIDPHDDKDEEEYDAEDEFEDLAPPDNPVFKKMMANQDAMNAHWEKNKKTYSMIVAVGMLLGYFAYFGYAMYYSFGDEGSIRLLWLTCLVVFCFCIWLIKKRFGEQIWVAMEPCYSKLEPHGMKINWTILGLVYVFIIIYVIVDVVVVNKEPQNLVSLAGIVLFVLLFFVFSASPAHVNWRSVLWGLALQFIFALLILRTWWGFAAFGWLGQRVEEFLAHTDAGSKFIFGEAFMAHYFAFKVLPVVIFFSTCVSVLYYLGAMQVVIMKVAWVMQLLMGTTAGESLNAAGNIFIGQSEAALMIRPMVGDMTRSELHAVMTGGFSTIAGAVMAAYVLMGVPVNHLISASVMSAPAALAMAKLFYPETQKSKLSAEDVQEMPPSPDRNVIEAASSGASQAISLVANIAATLIAFIAVLHFINATLTWFGHRVGLMEPHSEELTLEFICSYLLFPFALVMGTEIPDCRKMAQLIGVKTFLTEFVAYSYLGEITTNMAFTANHTAHNGTTSSFRDGIWLHGGSDVVNTWVGAGHILSGETHAVFNGTDVFLTRGILTERSRVIATYALCGFANFGAMGVQLGVLSAMAPHRKGALSKVVLRALIAGNVACFMTASIAGLLYQDEALTAA